MPGKIILGLGNPEPWFYAKSHNPDFALLKKLQARGLFEATNETRHNAGFRVVDAIACCSPFNSEQVLPYQYYDTMVDDTCLTLVRHVLGMNTSGVSARMILRDRELTPADLLVVHDDISLPLGQLRFQRGGSDGKHNGVKSVMQELGVDAKFDRLKVGVGLVPKGASILDFVLSTMPDEIHTNYEMLIADAVDAANVWATRGMQQAMQQFNGRRPN